MDKEIKKRLDGLLQTGGRDEFGEVSESEQFEARIELAITRIEDEVLLEYPSLQETPFNYHEELLEIFVADARANDGRFDAVAFRRVVEKEAELSLAQSASADDRSFSCYHRKVYENDEEIEVQDGCDGEGWTEEDVQFYSKGRTEAMAEGFSATNSSEEEETSEKTNKQEQQ